MADSERLVRFNLLGQEYQFYTGSSEEEMDQILGMVRKIVEDSSAAGTGVSVNKVVVMSCLNIASRYIKLKQEHENYKQETERKIAHINNDIIDKIS